MKQRTLYHQHSLNTYTNQRKLTTTTKKMLIFHINEEGEIFFFDEGKRDLLFH